ncbi:hypothetical protein [Photorhabdus aegyptia]|nr:hypothetical protein [Photorhabdus aegyptia]
MSEEVKQHILMQRTLPKREIIARHKAECGSRFTERNFRYGFFQ